ncbi:uncharacterized protein BP01DRAFT_43183 [Aspergillus saccharolyticus JOP 1030-1]|uniref:Uncharacterized protein n=1 Tax=Aspergillus saccharolyticus JOP 1030-1 TaxID=1450539 RepID=A0A318ZGM6_9EURO|nr:hypothetical protein BP01DRAFT_43183 [Aspergillus saccharolyticus JOP 1030-1]PYH45524.1 hypothetical protein BP01DRAFT_43183 [Aspergillus saccharolyticus JOP 1030-1]
MRGMQSNLLPLKSNSNEGAPHLERYLSGRWTPDIEKNQLYYESPDDRNDVLNLLSALYGYRSNSLLGVISFILFSILSFFAAAYYFWSLMPCMLPPVDFATLHPTVFR